MAVTELIAVLSTGKGTWAEVDTLIKNKPWERVFLITSEFGKGFTAPNTQLVIVHPEASIETLREDIVRQLKGKIAGFEVALNLSSGNGKEHMAVTAALIKLGVGFRLVAVTEKGFQEL